jgi:hypothetical protein
MKKPIKGYVHEPVYSYTDVIHYLEKKYKFNSRDFANKHGGDSESDRPYQDFWHWVVGNDDEIRNGSYTGICVDYFLENSDTPDWVKTILGYFKKEFPEDSEYMEMWVEW